VQCGLCFVELGYPVCCFKCCIAAAPSHRDISAFKKVHIWKK